MICIKIGVSNLHSNFWLDYKPHNFLHSSSAYQNLHSNFWLDYKLKNANEVLYNWLIYIPISG